MASRDSSSRCPQKCQEILGTCLRQLGYPLRLRQYNRLYTSSHSMAPWMASSSDVGYWTCWMFWWMGIERDSVGGEAT